MRIAIAADHAGFHLKELLINFLKEDPTIYENVSVERRKELYKVEIEKFNLDNNDNLKLLDKLSLGVIK